MGSCSSNAQNGGQGFNDGTNDAPRQAGNMPTNPEQPQPEAAAANAEANAMPNGLASPQMNGMANPMQPMQPPQAGTPAPQAAPADPQGAAANGQGRPWIDFDPRTGKPMLANGQVGFQETGNQIPLDNADANRMAFEAAAGSPFNGQANENPQPNELEIPPQAGQAYGSPLYIGAVSADVTEELTGMPRIVSEKHWEEFEAANNVMSLEEYQRSII